MNEYGKIKANYTESSALMTEKQLTRNPETEKVIFKQTFWQVIFPVLLVVVLILTIVVLLVIGKHVAIAAVIADYISIYLLLILSVLLLPITLTLIIMISLVSKGNHSLPAKAYTGSDFLMRIKHKTDRITDTVAERIIAAKSVAAGFKSISKVEKPGLKGSDDLEGVMYE